MCSAGGCNPRCLRLQPYVLKAATHLRLTAGRVGAGVAGRQQQQRRHCAEGLAHRIVLVSAVRARR